MQVGYICTMANQQFPLSNVYIRKIPGKEAEMINSAARKDLSEIFSAQVIQQK